MYRFLGIHFSLWFWFMWPLRILLRINIKPTELNSTIMLNNVKNRKIIYVIPRMSIIDVLVLNLALKKLKMPRIKAEATPSKMSEANVLALKSPSGVLFLENISDSFTTYLINLLNVFVPAKNDEIALYPVSIFWSRTPEKTERNFILKMLFPDDGNVGFIQKLWVLLIHGRNIHVHFGTPIGINERILSNSSESNETLIAYPELMQAKTVRRYLLVDFKKERAAALGPALYDFNNIANQIILQPDTQKLLENSGSNLQKAQDIALSYLKEISADYNYATVRAGEALMDFALTKMFKGVRVRNLETSALSAKGQRIIWMPCHRSHVDYLLLSYILSKNGLVAPHIAAGINLNFWPMGPIFRRCGAFFLRRSFAGNRIYSHIFATYVDYLIQNNFPLEFFHEGGRSRIGKLLTPKKGLLSICMSSIIRRKTENVVIIPIYFGYEKVLEDDSYARELLGSKKQKENLWQLFGIFPKLFSTYGRVDVAFAKPISISEMWTNYVQEMETAGTPLKHNAATLPSTIAELPSELDPRDDKIQDFVKYLSAKVNKNINATATASGSSLLASVLLAQAECKINTVQIKKHLNLLKWIVGKLNTLLQWDIATSEATENNDDIMLSSLDNSQANSLEIEKKLGNIIVEKRPYKRSTDSDLFSDEIIQNAIKWKLLFDTKNKSKNGASFLERNKAKEMNWYWYRGTIFHILAVPGLVSALLIDLQPEHRSVENVTDRLQAIRDLWETELYWPDTTSSQKIVETGLILLQELGIIKVVNSSEISVSADKVNLEILYFLSDLIRPERELYSILLTSASVLTQTREKFQRAELFRIATNSHRSAFLRGVALTPANLSQVFGGRTFEALQKANIIQPKENGYIITRNLKNSISEFFELDIWREFIDITPNK